MSIMDRMQALRKSGAAARTNVEAEAYIK